MQRVVVRKGSRAKDLAKVGARLLREGNTVTFAGDRDAVPKAIAVAEAAKALLEQTHEVKLTSRLLGMRAAGSQRRKQLQIEIEVVASQCRDGVGP
eukprot:Polyplicarium_translucidae@DN596_c0_g1_i1.p3